LHKTIILAMSLTSLLGLLSGTPTSEVPNKNNTQTQTSQELADEYKAQEEAQKQKDAQFLKAEYERTHPQEVDGWQDIYQFDYEDIDVAYDYSAADAGCSWGALTIQLMRSGMDKAADGKPMSMPNLIDSLHERNVAQSLFVVDYIQFNKENSAHFFGKDWIVETKVNPGIAPANDSSDSNSLQGLTLEQRKAALAWGENQGFKMILLYEGDFGHYLAYINPTTLGDTGGFATVGGTSTLTDEEDDGNNGVYSLMNMSHITYLDIHKR